MNNFKKFGINLKKLMNRNTTINRLNRLLLMLPLFFTARVFFFLLHVCSTFFLALAGVLFFELLPDSTLAFDLVSKFAFFFSLDTFV